MKLTVWRQAEKDEKAQFVQRFKEEVEAAEEERQEEEARLRGEIDALRREIKILLDEDR